MRPQYVTTPLLLHQSLCPSLDHAVLEGMKFLLVTVFSKS